MTERRTKRRYAHELYPHPDEGEVRDLETDVPYLYALAIGLIPMGTSWLKGSKKKHAQRRADRITMLMFARHLAFTADAIAQGMTGDEAWKWATERANEESDEWVFERAEHYGVNPDLIKPYKCGPEPETHDHLEPYEHRLYKKVVTVNGKESECLECTETVEVDGE